MLRELSERHHLRAKRCRRFSPFQEFQQLGLIPEVRTRMFAAQADRAGVDLITVDGTHFFLQEDTERAASLVREHLRW